MTQFFNKRLNLETHNADGSPKAPTAHPHIEPTLDEIARFQEEAVLYPTEQGYPAVNLAEIKENAEKVMVGNIMQNSIEHQRQHEMVQGVPMKEMLGISSGKPFYSTDPNYTHRDMNQAPTTPDTTAKFIAGPLVAGTGISSTDYLPPYLHRRDRFTQVTANGLTFLGQRARPELGEMPIDVMIPQGYYSPQELMEIANLAQKMAGVLYPGVKSGASVAKKKKKKAVKRSKKDV